jgi:hypothetical protein
MLRYFIVMFFSLVASTAAYACTITKEDEIIVEYYNQLNFEQEITILIQDAGTQYVVSLICPSPPSSTTPGPDFNLNMVDASNVTSGSSCASGKITIVKDDMIGNKVSYCKNSVCQFKLTLKNSSSGTVYSQTQVQLTMTSGDKMIYPNLQAATIPICDGNTSCLFKNTCTSSTSQTGTLSLCESGSSCSQPAYSTSPNQSAGYTYNSQIYFQVTVSDQVN